MHLGLARAQLLPRSDGYRRFTGSPIDALVYLVGLSWPDHPHQRRLHHQVEESPCQLQTSKSKRGSM